ncbi:MULTISPECIES: hypothetical protein [unclassified Marinobacter]|uniref:hypothetical protein n=1 Tax=unclassified Marinobacter TaxID=83889 RepID=UPI0019291883|nr:MULTISPECIES: hypothetical protein [unclassified Marinobacter]MBL3827368.1 hypothetical protein [Marinobacter sp. MC3]MBL3895881.1 hypothetical protein [Marinobacter sp. MW3]
MSDSNNEKIWRLVLVILISGTNLSIFTAVTKPSSLSSPDASSFLFRCHHFLENQSRVAGPIWFLYKMLDLKPCFKVIFLTSLVARLFSAPTVSVRN